MRLRSGLFALSGTAYAADVVQEEPPAPAPVAELPVASWAGPYAGINLGYGFSGRAKTDFGDTNTDGFDGSVFGGYPWQQDNFVYGGELEFGYNGAKGSDNGVDAKGGFEGSLRARLGYAVTPEILLYGTTGGALKDQKDRSQWLQRQPELQSVGLPASTPTSRSPTMCSAMLELPLPDFGGKNSGQFSGLVDNADNCLNVIGMKLLKPFLKSQQPQRKAASRGKLLSGARRYSRP